MKKRKYSEGELYVWISVGIISFIVLIIVIVGVGAVGFSMGQDVGVRNGINDGIKCYNLCLEGKYNSLLCYKPDCLDNCIEDKRR